MLVKASERLANGVVCGVCAHDVSHPLWASVEWMVAWRDRMDFGGKGGDDLRTEISDHYCPCKCCQTDEWMIETLKVSVLKANEMIFSWKDRNAALLSCIHGK